MTCPAGGSWTPSPVSFAVQWKKRCPAEAGVTGSQPLLRNRLLWRYSAGGTADTGSQQQRRSAITARIATTGMPATRQAMEVDCLARQPSRQRNAEPLPSRAEVVECELCRRKVDRYTVHHLVPRAKGGRFGPKAKLCATCHRQLHALFSEATLAQELNSIPRLQANPQVHDYLKWVRKQKSPGGFRVRRANNRR